MTKLATLFESLPIMNIIKELSLSFIGLVVLLQIPLTKDIYQNLNIRQEIIYTDYLVAENKIKIKKETQSEIETLISYYSNKHQVNEDEMLATAKCESGLNISAIGDGGLSIGIVQIHLPAHPEITKEQALNPVFSIDFMAKEFKKGNQWKWTCWRNIFAKK